MKRFLFITLFFLLTFFLLRSPSEAFAQTCTGESGGSGTCTAPMACPPANIDGEGTCSTVTPDDPYDICCLDELPPGDGGTGDCSDYCTGSDQCLDTPNNLDCTNGVCTHSTVCAPCTGNSGYAGSCLTPGVCSGLGKNSGDGIGSCSGGSVCCTNAPSSESCTITHTEALVGAYFSVYLNSTEANTMYTITTSPSCIGSCLGNHTTNSSGYYECTLDCGPPAGAYTITAEHGVVSCSTVVNVLNTPGLSCTGNSGSQGWCVVIACPQGTISDGIGDCDPTVPYNRCCVSVLASEERCGPGNAGINTAIGCIPVESTQEFIGFLLRWGIGIAGGIAFILIIYAGFMIITSAGNPQRLQAGKELLTAAIAGLMMLVFSAFILEFIGVNILNIPDFGR